MSTRTLRTPSTGCKALVIARSQCSHEMSGTLRVTLLIGDFFPLRNGDSAAHARGVVARDVAAILQRCWLVERISEPYGFASWHVDLAGLGMHGCAAGHLALVVQLLLGGTDEELVRDRAGVSNLK